MFNPHPIHIGAVGYMIGHKYMYYSIFKYWCSSIAMENSTMAHAWLLKCYTLFPKQITRDTDQYTGTNLPQSKLIPVPPLSE